MNLNWLKKGSTLLLLIACANLNTLYGQNLTPTFQQSTYEFTVSDKTPLNTLVGKVTATDPENSPLTYSIVSGNVVNSFTINTSNGALNSAITFNHHTQSTYRLTVKATDNGGLSSTTTVYVDVDPGPTLSSFGSIKWTTAASQPYTVNEGHGKVVNGKLYAFGGFDSVKLALSGNKTWVPTDRAYVFDSTIQTTNAWNPIAPMPRMNNGTCPGGITHTGCTTDGRDIYFAGGYTANTSGSAQIFGTKEVWKYIVAENRYERLPDLPLVHSCGQMEYLEGKLHLISRTSPSRTADYGDHFVLDLGNLSAGWKTLAPLPNPTQHAGSTVFEGKIYFLDGQNGHDATSIPNKRMRRYDPATDTWTSLADVPVPAGKPGREHICTSVVVFGNRLLLLGGETGFNKGISDWVSAYNPATDTWDNLTPLPTPKWAGVAFVINGEIYYTGGSYQKSTFKGTPVYGTPVVNLTDPLPGAIFTPLASIHLAATAHGVDGANIQKVEFLNGTNVLSTATTAPYTFSWNNVPTGTYNLAAKAYDNLGHTTISGVIKTVVAPPPTVTLNSPKSTDSFKEPATINLSATATAYGTIKKVDFYNGSTLIISDTTSPYSYAWNNVKAGNYTLTAKAYDDRGLSTTSSSVAITVASSTTTNQAPAITSQPVNTTVTAGQTATFNVTATGTAPLSYQWKKNGVAISGANSASYTTPVTVIADNGALYSVVVSNSVNSVTSNSATLTVNAPPQQVTSLILVNSDTDEDIITIHDGDQFNLATLLTRNLNIRGTTSPATVGSVLLDLSGAVTHSATENMAPYGLYPNPNGDFSAWTPPVGNYTLTATPYSGSSGSGTKGTALTVSFSIIDQAP